MEEKLNELYKEYLYKMLDATIETKEKNLNNQETNIDKEYKKVSKYCGLGYTPMEELISRYTSRDFEPHKIYRYNFNIFHCMATRMNFFICFKIWYWACRYFNERTM